VPGSGWPPGPGGGWVRPGPGAKPGPGARPGPAGTWRYVVPGPAGSREKNCPAGGTKFIS
jgi:hypothetical protein